nr:hypothetical protein [uncultured Sphingomonas sp.]
MIPMKHSTIFKSRWWALLWASGIIWFALTVAAPDSAPASNNEAAAQQTDVLGQPIDEAQAEALLNQAISIN